MATTTFLLATVFLVVCRGASAVGATRHLQQHNRRHHHHHAQTQTTTDQESAFQPKAATYKVVGEPLAMHSGPTYDDPLVEHILVAGEVFDTSGSVKAKDGSVWLQLSDGRGWLKQRHGRIQLAEPEDGEGDAVAHHHRHAHKKKHGHVHKAHRNLVHHSRMKRHHSTSVAADTEDASADLTALDTGVAQRQTTSQEEDDDSMASTGDDDDKDKDDDDKDKDKDAKGGFTKKGDEIAKDTRHKDDKTMTLDWRQEVPQYQNQTGADQQGHAWKRVSPPATALLALAAFLLCQ